MKTVEVKQATAPLAEYARDLENEPIIRNEGRLIYTIAYQINPFIRNGDTLGH